MRHWESWHLSYYVVAKFVQSLDLKFELEVVRTWTKKATPKHRCSSTFSYTPCTFAACAHLAQYVLLQYYEDH